MAIGNTPQSWPKDGVKLGLEGTTVALKDEDLDRLAVEQLPVRVDWRGKSVASARSPAGQGLALRDQDPAKVRAGAALCWEDYVARYKDLAKKDLLLIGDDAQRDIMRFLAKEEGKDDFRTVRTFSFPGKDGAPPSSIMLVGVSQTSLRSRQLAARAVYEVEPSALLLQLCRERVGRHLVIPPEHLATVANYARSYAAGNPHGYRTNIYMADLVNGDYESLLLWMRDLAYTAAFDEFLQVPSKEGSAPKVLCLGDVLASRLEQLRKLHGNETLSGVPTLSARGKALTRGLVSLCSLGHRQVMGVISVELLSSVTAWLERAGARFMAAADASDIEAGRESLAQDAQLGLTGAKGNPRPKAVGIGRTQLGAFLNEQGLRALQARRQRLAKMTRVRDLVRHRKPMKNWQVAQLLGGGPVDMPGPGNVEQSGGLQFEFGQLEVPEDYLREAGAEQFGPELWASLYQSGSALETQDLAELDWWLAGALEVA